MSEEQKVHSQCPLTCSSFPVQAARAAHKIAEEKLRQKTQFKPDSRLTLFYSVCQAACYIVCYHGDLLKWGRERLGAAIIDESRIVEDDPPSGDLSFLCEGDKSLVSIFNSSLAPLVQCKRGIVKEFIDTCR